MSSTNYWILMLISDYATKVLGGKVPAKRIQSTYRINTATVHCSLNGPRNVLEADQPLNLHFHGEGGG